MSQEKRTGPTTERQRYLILDALRGIALMGIALANYPEFALWTFLGGEEQAAMPTAAIDRVVRYLQYMLVDGKFYTIFSILFGIGFSLILERHGRRLFVRRVMILLVIGFLHLMFIWSGDILLLYAVGGLLLTLFIGLKDKILLVLALALILIPVGLDAITEFGGVDFASPFYQAWWNQAEIQGINEDNFASWLRDAHSYDQVFAFLTQGAYERIWEFVEGHRLPKVVGLFILGYLIGKHRLYTRLQDIPLRSIVLCTAVFALPISALYAWSAVCNHPWGRTIHSLLYAISVIPLALVYITGICKLFLQKQESTLFRSLSAPGRMALSNYISQSLVGIILFYGLGFGLGTTFGLVHVELTALAVFIIQVLLSKLWLHWFHFGPLEWIWRMMTYGRYFPPKKQTRNPNYC